MKNGMIQGGDEMIKVITYGTFDLLHEGHIRLLRRAKALGDYLIVGVTSDVFDQSRGKINVVQSLSERMQAVKDLKIADEIIVEEYEGQKIDDIKRYGVDIFAIGSDWTGKFDYLKQYCQVIYLERTIGISSTQVRSKESKVRLGFVGKSNLVYKTIRESKFVNGVSISGLITDRLNSAPKDIDGKIPVFQDFGSLLDASDAIYIVSSPRKHYDQIKEALNKGKHVLCESPICLEEKKWLELKEMAKKSNLVLMDALKTAYSTAYYRLLLLIKTGVIGDVVSVDATSTSLMDLYEQENLSEEWSSFPAWGTSCLMAAFQILGTDVTGYDFISKYRDQKADFDTFVKVNINFPHSTATCKCGIGVKSEGDLIVSGTKGYIYVPSPWWKTDYFEIRFENPSENKKVFYPLDGEGIRYEILSFVRSIVTKKDLSYISDDVSRLIVRFMESFIAKKNLTII